MADWDKHNLACVNTWAFLRGLGEFNDVFSKAGKLKMNELRFWNDLATPAAREQDARMLASRLDRIFIKALLAKYESGVTLIVAIDGLTGEFVDKKNTLADLADQVDGLYNFQGELK